MRTFLYGYAMRQIVILQKEFYDHLRYLSPPEFFMLRQPTMVRIEIEVVIG
jgi:hypothetical protein